MRNTLARLSRKTLPLLVIAFSILGCEGNSRAIKKEMVELDRVYIPTLFYTSQKNSAKSRQAISKLQVRWEQFHTNHYRDNADTVWRNAFDDISGLISRADGLLNTGDGTESAHEGLEEIRVILNRLRSTYDIRIFSDYLTAFHKPLEDILLAVQGITAVSLAESLTDSTLINMRKLTDEAQDIWKTLDTVQLDSAIYGQTAAKKSKLRSLIREEALSLEALRVALHFEGSQDNSIENKRTIIELVRAIKPPFVKVYTHFGAFEE